MSNIIKFEELEAKLISYHDKFPDGYILELTKGEKQEVVKNFDHLN